MQGITPFLWFENEAEEAANFYTSVFKDSEIRETLRYPEGSPVPAGSVLTVTFRIGEFEMTALNGGPHDQFNDSVSFFVNCEDQAEVDYYWDALLDGGQPSQCGWLKDRYGVAWQVAPVKLLKLINDPNPERARRAIGEMMTQTKIDLAAIERAADEA